MIQIVVKVISGLTNLRGERLNLLCVDPVAANVSL